MEMEILKVLSYPAAHFPFLTTIPILGPKTFSLLLLFEYFIYAMDEKNHTLPVGVDLYLRLKVS